MSELAKTAKQIKKNTGPKTKQGKSAVALNAIRHGIQSKSVLPDELEAYKLHSEAVSASLEPEGYLEQRLAERVSLTLWRLTRLETWEASVLAQRHRSAWESALFDTNGLSRLIASLSDRGNLAAQPVAALDLSEVFQELQRLAFGEPAQLLQNWEDTRLAADTFIEGGESLTAFYTFHKETQAEVTAEQLLSLNPEALDALARRLADILEQWGVKAETVVKALLGDEYSLEDVEAFESGDWEWQAAELPGLWRLYSDEYAQRPGEVDSPHLTAFRVGLELQRNGERLLELGERAKMLLSEQQAHAVMLSDAEVQKLQRYEAHLERILYRALHELEAMKERRTGHQPPLARVEVHGLE